MAPRSHSGAFLMVVVSLGCLVGTGCRGESTDASRSARPPAPSAEVTETGWKAAESSLPGATLASFKSALPLDWLDPPVAFVNRIPITRSAVERVLDRRLAIYRRSGRRIDAEWRNQERLRIVRELVEEEMLRQHLAANGILIGDEALDEVLATEIETVFGSSERFQRYLDGRGLTLDEYRRQRRFDLGLESLFAQMGTVEVDPEAVRDYYARFRASWHAPERVRVATIGLRLPQHPSPEQVAEAERRLGELRQQIADGADFAELARAQSETPEAANGGEMGWVYRDDRDIEPGVAAVLFELPPGGVSAPVRTRLGVQLFTVMDRRPEGLRDFDEVEDSLTTLVTQRQRRLARVRLLATLQRQFRVTYLDDQLAFEAAE